MNRVLTHGLAQPASVPDPGPDHILLPLQFSGPSFEQRKRDGKKSGKWRAIWRIQMPGWDTVHKRGKGGFATQKEAENWARRVRDAHSLNNGWSFDHGGYPINAVAVHAERAASVLADLESFVELVGRHDWKSDSHFEKQRSVLIRTAAHLLDDPTVTGPLLEAWEAQTHNQRERPEPSNDVEWAGRYLRDAFLTRVPVPEDDLDDGLARGRRWLFEHSITREQLAVPGALDRLHQHLTMGADGKPAPASTQRGYWGLVRRWARWLVERRAIPGDVTAGYHHAKRVPAEDKVDPRRVPDQPTIWTIAISVGLKARRIVEGMLVLVMAYGALRIGEACDLRRRDVRFLGRRTGGGAMLTAYNQWDNPSHGHPDDDAPSKPNKGYATNGGGQRTTYLARRVAALLGVYMAVFVDDSPDAPLFPGKKARRVEPDTFRRDTWNPVIEKLFADDKHLRSLDTHDLRAAGMTMWLRQRVPFQTVATWGGWQSRKIMLDVYASVLPDDDDLGIWMVEGGRVPDQPRLGEQLTPDARRALARRIWEFRSLLLADIDAHRVDDRARR